MTRRFAVMLLAVLTLMIAMSWMAMAAERTPVQQLPSQQLPAQQIPADQADRFKVIKAQDAALYGAVNRCDLKTLGDMVTEDLEFYHDLTGSQWGGRSSLRA